MFYRALRPLLFSLAPERAHDLSLRALDLASRLEAIRLIARRPSDDPVTAMGLRFSNRVGLAAGLDKNAEHIDALGDLGFGFIEVGTVTPWPQAGNAKPRIFRLVPESALINRMGFNNEGVDRFLKNVRRHRRFRASGGIVGLNIGKNAATPMERALDDYVIGLRKVYAHADYVTVNISSPNTKNLRELQGATELRLLLAGLVDERKRLEDQHRRRVPIAVKIAPDLEDDALAPIADLLVEYGLDAVIATNTTIARNVVERSEYAAQAGGLSGAPLRARSTRVIALLATHLSGALPIIGVGGIMTGADAVEKIQAGAALVQLYTGFIYQGPKLVSDCVEAIRTQRHGPAS